jgi:murein L,D-transpeptidase YcbB/YkuD
LTEPDTTSSVFDEPLAGAVERFQGRHGLVVDGVVGQETRAALNVGVDVRIRQIAASLERLRSLPDITGDRVILVNVAGFELYVFEGGKITFNSAVVVGRLSRPTPALSSAVTRIIVNPYWRVPRRIAINDILPQIRRDPAYLGENGFRVFSASLGSLVEVAAGDVNWNSLNRHNFPYLLVQDPGASNALGRVKFFFPNDRDIFMHDTPAQDLFKHKSRAFSSGCIRVSKAVELAAFLLKPEREGPYQAMVEALASGETRQIALTQPIPLHIVYLTAWADKSGPVHFRDDIYGLDAIADMGVSPHGRGGHDVARAYESVGTECAAVPEATGELR